MRSRRAHAALLAVTATLVSSCGGGSDVAPAPPPAAAPTFSPEAPLNFRGSLEVALATSTAGATIRYTTDGTDPTASSSTYLGPIVVGTTTVVKAYATGGGAGDSGIATGAYAYRPIDLVVDDGTTFASISFGTPAGETWIMANRFTPAPEDFPFELRTIRARIVDVADLRGLRLAVYADPEGVPSTAALLGTWAVPSFTASPAWTEVALAPPVRLTGPGDVFVAIVSSSPFQVVLNQASAATSRLWVGRWPAGSTSAPRLPTGWEYNRFAGWDAAIRGSN
jgi:hypothetical protein